MARRRQSDRGAGLIGTIAGVTVFLAFLTVATQILLNLYAASVVTSAAYDAARRLASDAADGIDRAELRAAEDHARSLMGAARDRSTLEWDLTDPSVVRLRVITEPPRFLLPVVDGALGLDVIDRTVAVRIEEPQQ